MHKNQHAFQTWKSTETLHDLESQIEETHTNKEYLIATFMDIAGAFDNISLETINDHIERCDINIHVTHWIKYMLAHRSIPVEADKRTQ